MTSTGELKTCKEKRLVVDEWQKDTVIEELAQQCYYVEIAEDVIEDGTARYEISAHTC